MTSGTEAEHDAGPAADGPYLRMKGISKVYDNGVAANDGVDLAVQRGEIHGLVGENGAGKSTLMKVLYGLERPDHGQIVFRGQPVEIASARDAIALGIGMVHQHFMLVPSLTVAESVVLGREPRRGPFVDRRRAAADVGAAAKSYGLDVPPRAVIRDLSVGQRQRVEILKALYRGAELLILDEPTAVLTPQETDELFAALRGLVDDGLTIIFITHKLREVVEISDRVTVMRDGRTVSVRRTADVTRGDISRLMVGRDDLFEVSRTPHAIGEPRLRVRDLSAVSAQGRPVLRSVSLDVAAGEVYGIAGVEGNGQTELVEILTGLRPATAGSATVDGTPLLGRSPRRIRELGVAHIPEDRLGRGVASGASVVENLALDRYRDAPAAAGLRLRPKVLEARARELVERFAIRIRDPGAPVAALSGGNMQKVVIARELAEPPSVLVAAQPTRGVDIGAIEFIHAELLHLRDAGTAILLVSAELSEIRRLADRIAVLYEGELVGEFDDPDAVDDHELGLYMLGARRTEARA